MFLTFTRSHNIKEIILFLLLFFFHHLKTNHAIITCHLLCFSLWKDQANKMCGCINMWVLLVFRPPSPDSATSKINSWWQTWNRHYYYYYTGTYWLVSVAETGFLSSPNPFVCVYVWWCLCPLSTVSGMACVAERAGPDCHCSNRNWENFGLPAAWIHSYGRTACVSTGCF